jgi:(p)ppGpp synthase/HD superfamily hydrolase
MQDSERISLERLVLAPYIQKATALIGHRRRVGGNQFRHAMATLAILIDYHYTDTVLLKASVIHDLFEDVPETTPESIACLDEGPAVLRLVLEVTRRRGEDKEVFLARILHHGSRQARVLKVADRISNLTDLHHSVFEPRFVAHYLEQTERHVYPMALATNPEMGREIADLLTRRRTEPTVVA